MPPEVTERAVRVLVDQSRDVGCSGGAADLQPPQQFSVAISHERLKLSTLRRYDVLVIAGCTPARYTKAELAAIKSFVHAGGGLLVASCAGAYEHYTGRPATDLPLNQVARLLGAEFLSPWAAAGQTQLGEDLVRGLPNDVLKFARHEAFAGAHPAQLHLRCSAPLKLPPQAEPLAWHAKTQEPVGAALLLGKGRMAIFGDVSIAVVGGEVCSSVVSWLGASRAGRDHIRSFLGKRVKPFKAIRLHNTCATELRGWWHSATVGFGAGTSGPAGRRCASPAPMRR